MSDEAKRIYQAYLDLASDALWDERFEDMAACMEFPLVLKARDLTQRIANPEELHEVARITLDSMRRLGATAYHRVCLTADFLPGNPDVIIGRHRIFLLRGGTYVVDPYEGSAQLHRRAGQWRGAGIADENDLRKITTLDPSRARRGEV
jgi:hypothetical protein